MSRYIDADELGKVKFHPLPYTHIVPNGENVQSYERGWNDAIDAVIENASTVDAVELVRCKDCVMWEKRYPNEQGFMCCPSSGMDITENDYCSWGEKVSK